MGICLGRCRWWTVLIAALLYAAGAGSAAAAGEGCAEPQFIRVAPLTTGQTFSLSESVGCLPSGDAFSGAVIHWGDGTASPGTIADSGGRSSAAGSVEVLGQHAYEQPGSFGIRISVTDDSNGETYEGGWHTVAQVSAPVGAGPPPESPPNPAPGPAPAPGPGAKASAEGTAFTTVRQTRRRHVVATLQTTLAPDELRADIRWGDGSKSRGTIAGETPELTISGRHRWHDTGLYRLVVTVTGPHGERVARVYARAHVRRP